MQPHFVNHSSVLFHTYADLIKIRKFSESLSLASGIRVLSQQSVSLCSVFFLFFVLIIYLLFFLNLRHTSSMTSEIL